MDKNIMRKHVKELMSNLSNEYCQKSDELIYQKLINSKEFQKAKILFIYVSKDKEVDSKKIIEYSLNKNKIICVPKCIDNNMKVYRIESLSDLEPGNFNILEPKSYCKEIDKKDIDLNIIPCLTCDENGNRLGYGKGYYDRFLSDIDSLKICLCRKKLLQKAINFNEHDIKMNIIITD